MYLFIYLLFLYYLCVDVHERSLAAREADQAPVISGAAHGCLMFQNGHLSEDTLPVLARVWRGCGEVQPDPLLGHLLLR